MSKARIRILFITTVIALLGVSQTLTAQFRGARDPGVRGGPAGAGGAIAGLSGEENTMFEEGLADFGEEESVADGLIENFTDTTILNNLNSNSLLKRAVGISGRVNRNGNDGRISRFGWKAQNPSLLVFSGEAYNVEMGITSEAFPIERDETLSCQFAKVPNDGTPSVGQIPAIVNFANFQRFLAPPTPVTIFTGATSDSVAHGRKLFTNIGCALCHTPSLPVNQNATVVALRNQGQAAYLFSDLALHALGPGLADDILQGAARGDEFRTAPLWGLGKRVFFLHDGRTNDLDDAIQAHASGGNTKFGPSEANAVISIYNRLSSGDQQDLLNFLRSL